VYKNKTYFASTRVIADMQVFEHEYIVTFSQLQNCKNNRLFIEETAIVVIDIRLGVPQLFRGFICENVPGKFWAYFST
jgi:hypothetical protein